MMVCYVLLLIEKLFNLINLYLQLSILKFLTSLNYKCIHNSLASDQEFGQFLRKHESKKDWLLFIVEI